ncbi:MAG TPA: helix-turn-helix domain-containing protein [Gemmatimonadales bacterium]|nr:helix-turn-helix domain-containing protein [Gemmatimonadales bacterium]
MDKRITEIHPDAMQLLMDYAWPGNVRELINAIERAMVVGTPPTIRPEDLPVWGKRSTNSFSGESLADVEKDHIASVLERTGWNITRAAEILRVDRVTVYNKIKKYDLRQPATRGGKK